MNRFNLHLIALFVLTVFVAHGQDEPERSKDVTITKSEPYPVIDSGNKNYYALANDRVLGVKITGGKKFVQFNFQVFSGLQLNLEHTVVEKVEEPGFQFEAIREIGENMYLFYAIHNSTDKTNRFFARKINTDKGGFDGPGTLLLTLENDKQVSIGLRHYYSNPFYLDVSADKKIFVVKYRKSPEEKDDSKNRDIIGLHIFRSDLSQVSGAEYEMPYTEALMDNLDFTVDSKGTGYFLIRKYREEANRKNTRDPENQSLAVLVMNNGDDAQEVEFSLGDKLPTSFVLSENTAGDLVCAGYYSKPGIYGVDGAYVAIMDKNHNFTDPKFYEFSKEFIMLYHKLSERRKEKVAKKDAEDELSLSDLTMRSIRMLSDGGIVLAGEIYYITTTTDSKGNTRTTYHYDDVITIKINKDGELAWMKKFPKRSTSSSFKLMASDEYSYVIFTDNPKNGQIATDQNPGVCSVKDRFVIAYRTNNETGESDYLPLFGYRQIDGTNVYQFALNRIIALTDNKFAAEMYIKGKEDMMFQVEFKEQ